jgi:molybdopterin converting factor small subunit
MRILLAGTARDAAPAFDVAGAKTGSAARALRKKLEAQKKQPEEERHDPKDADP